MDVWDLLLWAVAVAPGIRDTYWTISRKWTLDDLASAWTWIVAATPRTQPHLEGKGR